MLVCLFQAKNNLQSLTSAHNPDDPFNDEARERLQVEALAKKFENKYVSLFCSWFFLEQTLKLLLLCNKHVRDILRLEFKLFIV